MALCIRTVLADLTGKSFILLEAEDEFCQAFPVSTIQVLLFCPFSKQRGLGAEERYIIRLSKSIFMSFMAFRENCPGGTVHFSRTC